VKKTNVSRRSFIKKATGLVLGAAGFPHIVPASAMGRGGNAPSNRITLGCIGLGMQGIPNMRSFLEIPNVQVVALCDLDSTHLTEGKAIVDEKYQRQDCATYKNFEDLLNRPDIDAVMLAIPDHWHGIVAIAAARAGKDIYGEKPLAQNWFESKSIVNAVNIHGRIWQTGSWQRSVNNFRFAAELVRNGRIGKIQHVEVGLPQGHYDFAGTAGQETILPPPVTLDYDRWLGPAPWSPYCPARVHRNWRWNLDYAGGQLVDWISHHMDIGHWGMGCDYTGPVEIDGQGEYPRRGTLWNTATRYRINTRYANGITVTIAGGHADIQMGTRWIGDEGWVWVDRSGIDAHPKKLLRDKIGPNEIQLYRSNNHAKNFIDCVKSRQLTITPVEVAHRSASPGYLGQISMLLGRKIQWDPEKEIIRGDRDAERLLSRPMRAPWHL
jgi:predicted dehydrogenase